MAERSARASELPASGMSGMPRRRNCQAAARNRLRDRRAAAGRAIAVLD